MATIGVEFHRLALRDYNDSCKSYAKQSIDLKHRFKAAVDAAVERISKEPEALPRYQSSECDILNVLKSKGGYFDEKEAHEQASQKIAAM